ncbi:MAG: hypothetical protein AAFO73_08515 [Pseudomonadota bacterium]
MPTSSRRTIVSRLSLGQTAFATLLACAAIPVLAPVLASSTAHQDAAEMTGVDVAAGERWITRLDTVNRGSVHGMVGPKADETSSKTFDRVLAVRTAKEVHLLDPSHSMGTGRPMMVNTALKGPRLVAKKLETKQELKAAAVAMLTVKPVAGGAALTGGTPAKQNPIDPIITGGSGTLMASASTSGLTLKAGGKAPTTGADAQSAAKRHLMAMASTFRLQQNGLQPFPDEAKGSRRVPLSKTQMTQARTAARQMAKVVKRLRKDTAKAKDVSQSTLLSAYAPKEKEIANAFASVLNDAPKGKGTSLIKLAKKDHAWAAFPLPKSSYTKRQRRCLTAGIYFEARGEPVLGQKAVAQVILNRVRNPTTPQIVSG